MESRPYWLQGGIRECEEPGCAERPDGPRSALVDADTAFLALVGPCQYQYTDTGWVLPLPDTGWVLPLPYPPGYRPLTVTAMHEYTGPRVTRNMHIWPF